MATTRIVRPLVTRFLRLGKIESLSALRHPWSRSLTYYVEDENDPTWKEMNDKSRSLAKLLLDHDDWWMDHRPAAVTASDDNDNNNDDSTAMQDKEHQKAHAFNRRRALSQAITMIESQKLEHQRQSNLLLTYLLGHENNHIRKASSFRLGIAGPPGLFCFVCCVPTIFYFGFLFRVISQNIKKLSLICCHRSWKKHLCGSLWEFSFKAAKYSSHAK